MSPRLSHLVAATAALALLAGTAGASSPPRPATIAPDAAFTLPERSVQSPNPVPDGIPCSDGFEPNELCSSAPLVGPGVYDGIQVSNYFLSLEGDWYRVFVPSGQKLSVDLTFIHANGDVQMAIYPPDCSSLIVNSLSTTNAEHCEWTNAGAGAEYRIVVESWGPGFCTSYAMRITLTCTDAYDPGGCGSAPTLAAGFHPNLWITDSSTSGDIDWYKVHVMRGERLTATSTYLVAPANAEIGIITGDCNALLAYENSANNLVHSVTWDNNGPDVDVHVGLDPYSAGGLCYAYDLAIVLEGTGNLDNTQTYAGWSAPVVPRNFFGNDPSNVMLSPTLPGNANSTWINWTIRQTGPYDLNRWYSDLYVDGDLAVTVAPGSPAPPLDWTALSIGKFTMRGGRHTLMTFTDPANEIRETNEFDNSYSVQHVWSPLVTAFETPNVRAVPPGGFFFQPNTDGFQYTRFGGAAWVVSIASGQPGDDYDLIVYDDYAGSSSGFSNVVGGSTIGGHFTDFVVGHWQATPLTVYPGAYRFASASASNFAIDQSDARFRNWVPAQSPAHFLAQSMAANRLTDVYEAFLEAGSTVHFSLLRTSGPSDLRFAIYLGTPGQVYSGYAGIPSISVGTNKDQLTYTATVTGWHPIVVYRTDGTNAASAMTYDFNWTLLIVDAGEGPDVGELAFLGTSPNPMTGTGRFDFTLPRAGDVTISLHDAQGRKLSEVRSTGLEAGRQTIAWDGRTKEGAKLAPGVYWATLQFEGRQMTRRIVRL